ncbi:MAG: MurT ligase domain-containing protein [Chloroflexota bacterium]|nr:MurT ligase domain-containing protein [Chloroflexota bacterium]
MTTRARRGGPDLRLGLALGAARLTSAGSRRLGRGGGTAAPGLVADRIDPHLLDKLTARLPDGSVVIAGTNGKTTVSRMLADVLEASGRRVTHNRAGSNLARGVASALAARATLTGNPRADIAVIESDEAALPEILRRVTPRLVVLNNLFRDQLDRYGELNAIANLWRPALALLPAASTVAVNADDPTLAGLTEGIAARRVAFGLSDPNPRYQLAALPHAVDAAICRRCGSDLTYDALYSAHLGAWRCAACGAARPTLDIRGETIALNGVDSLRIGIERGGPAQPLPPLDLAVAIPGLFNVYNTVAVAAAATVLEVPVAPIEAALAAYRPAFGRIERISFRDRTIILTLVKNPVAFNETMRMLTIATGGLTVPTLIAINDLDADGRDVSWLWDVDFELLADGEAPLFTSGLRGADMANRLKYAGVPADRLHPLPNDLARGLDAFVDTLPAGGTGYILPTYTAMLGVRQVLAERGAVDPFWEQ